MSEEETERGEEGSAEKEGESERKEDRETSCLLRYKK